uniref:RPGRIP1 C-terminal domain-containing protein n=1 Tax=Chelonoidis abingdonii TaxID=106734 RepID=A0A8C0ISW4_CHEAB
MSLLLLDETAGDLPVRDMQAPCLSFPDVGLSELVVWTRQHVSQMNRAELENGFLHLRDENLVLKEFACKQEDRIKRYQQGPMKPITLTARILGSWRHGGAEEGMQGLQREHARAKRVSLYPALRSQPPRPPAPVPGFSHLVPGPSILAALQQGGAGVPLSCLCRSFFLPLHHQNQETLRTSTEALLAQLEALTVQLKAETQKVLTLESKVERISFLQGTLEEFQERIGSLEKERDLLKEDYDKLLERHIAGDSSPAPGLSALCLELHPLCPLLPLFLYSAGDCVLTNPAGHPNGSISLSLEWKHRYLPLGATLHQAAWAREHLHETPLEQLIEEERAALHSQVQNDPAVGIGAALTVLTANSPKAGCSCSHTLHSPWSEWEGRERADPVLIPLPVTSTLSLPAPEEACEPALESSSDAQTTDSDEIVVGTSLGSPPKVDMERIRIEIVSLSLHPEAEAMASEHIQQLYVAYHFPGVPLAETETPLSLRKPQGGEEIYFHFSKVIQLDTEGVSSQREILFSMLQAEEAGLQFVVVSEPPPGTGGECEDVGFAYMDLREILLTGNDVLERDLDVVSPQDHSAIGRLKVSVEAAAAFCAIYWEGRRKAEEEK